MSHVIPDFIAVFETFTDIEKLTEFCSINDIRLVKLDIPEKKNYNNNLKYFSTSFSLKNKLLTTFSDYKIIHDIEDPFIYTKKKKDDGKIELMYSYPRDRLIINK